MYDPLSGILSPSTPKQAPIKDPFAGIQKIGNPTTKSPTAQQPIGNFAGIQKSSSLVPASAESMQDYVKRTTPKASDLMSGVDFSNPMTYSPIDVGNAAKSGWNSLSGGVQDMWKGAGDMYNAASEGVQALASAVPQAVGMALNGPKGLANFKGFTGDTQQHINKSADYLMPGMTNLMSGAIQTIYSPVSALMGATPELIRKPIENSIAQDVGRIGGALTKSGVNLEDKYLQSIMKNVGSVATIYGINKNPEQFKQYLQTINPITAPKRIADTAKGLYNMVVPQNLEKELVKRGFHPADAQELVSTDPATKEAMARQLNAAEAANGRQIYGKMPTQPIEEAGKDIVDMGNHLADVRKTTGAQKSELMKSLPIRPIEATGPVQEYTNQLQDWGVKVTKSGKLSFDKSVIPNVADQKLLQDSMDDILKFSAKGSTVGNVQASPVGLERARQSIFSRLGGAPTTQPFTSNVDTAVSKLRSGLLDTISDAHPQMRDINTRYATVEKQLTDLGKMLQTPIKNIDSKQLKAGLTANTLLGKGMRSADKLEQLQNMFQVAKDNGYSGTFDNMLKKVTFSDTLENLYGTTKPQGLSGQVGRAFQAGVDVVGATKNPFSFARVAGNIVDTIKGQTPEKQIAALKKFLLPAQNSGVGMDINKLIGAGTHALSQSALQAIRDKLSSK